MTESERIQKSIQLLDEVNIELAICGQELSDSLYENLAKAISILEQLYYKEEAKDCVEEQSLDFD